MQRKKMTFNIQGMNRDLSKQRFDPKMAYSVKNMRLIATDEEHTTFALTTEKGNEEVTYSDTFDLSHYGTPIGLVETNDGMVIFFHNPAKVIAVGDYGNSIIEFTLDENTNNIIPRVLYSETGLANNLNLDINHPIEALFSYEAENIRKIYWVDGLNQPRMINIDEPADSPAKMDFVGELNLEEVVTITKNETEGLFAPGVIQYSFTYFNARGAESNIFYTSPLYYTTVENRGGKADETTTNSFTIALTNLNTTYKSIRIYSFLRTSLNGEGQAKIVAELNIPQSGSLTYTDKGIYGETIDPTKLLYIGGEEIIAGTLAQKDNTLFLGNIKNSVPSIYKYSELIQSIKLENLFSERGIYEDYIRRELIEPESTEYYKFNSSLNGPNIRTLKSKEYYRLGVQFQHKSGKWSDPVYIKTLQVTLHPNSDVQSIDKYIKVPEFKAILSNQLLDELYNYGYRRIRPVIAYPKLEERVCLYQGIVCPTVYNIKRRHDNTLFSQLSWFARLSPFQSPHSVLSTDDSTKPFTALLNAYSVLENTAITYDSIPNGQWLEYRNNVGLPPNVERNCEIQNSVDRNFSPIINIDDDVDEFVNKHVETYCVDKSIVTLHSPDLYYYDKIINQKIDSSTKFRIVGIAPIMSQYSKTFFEAAKPSSYNPTLSQYIVPITGYYLEDDIKATFGSPAGWKQQITGPVWVDFPMRNVTSVFILGDWDTTDVNRRGSIIPFYTKYHVGDCFKLVVSSTTQEYYYLPGGYMYDGSGSSVTTLNGKTHIIYLGENTWRLINNPLEDTYAYSAYIPTSYPIYPWHNIKSLVFPELDANAITKKIISRLSYSSITAYLDDSIEIPTYPIKEYISTEEEKIKFDVLDNSENIYSGNINDIITFSSSGEYINNVGETQNKQDGYLVTRITPDIEDSAYTGFKIFYPYISEKDTVLDRWKLLAYYGTPHIVPSYESSDEEWLVDYSQLNNIDDTTGRHINDPVALKYKSTPHFLISFKTDNEGLTKILPTYQDVSDTENNIVSSTQKFYWDSESKSHKIFEADTFNIPEDQYYYIRYRTSSSGYLCVGELYKDISLLEVEPQDVISQLDWYVAGPKTEIAGGEEIEWRWGDSYYQRFDCLRTYPFSEEDSQSVVDIVSFMCETRVNLDGRTDRNRGALDNTGMSPLNYNLINEVYTQDDNYFTYKILSEFNIHIDEFPNTITWTLSKTYGATIDNWTTVTLANTLDLDGDRGEIRALRLFNNNLLSFQDKGISQILYNEQVQIPTSGGVPIEISNSGKVQGKRYISSHGTTNKWSICTTAESIYFVDDITKDIFALTGEGLINISDKNGFHTYVVNNIDTSKIWTPTDFDKCTTTYYDRRNNEVMFTNNSDCLVFSENLGTFTEFISREKVPFLGTIKDRMFTFKSVNNSWKLYEEWVGDYFNFYGQSKDYGITFIANDDALSDKIFTNVEFEADSFTTTPEIIHNEIGFNILNAHTPYQDTNTSLVPKFTKKFRIWRSTLPRAIAGENQRDKDRIRNTNATIDFKYNPNQNSINNLGRTSLYNFSVIYYTK